MRLLTTALQTGYLNRGTTMRSNVIVLAGAFYILCIGCSQQARTETQGNPGDVVLSFFQAMLYEDYDAIYDLLPPEVLSDLDFPSKAEFRWAAPRARFFPQDLPPPGSILFKVQQVESGEKNDTARVKLYAEEKGGVNKGAMWVDVWKHGQEWKVPWPQEKGARERSRDSMRARFALVPLAMYEELRKSFSAHITGPADEVALGLPERTTYEKLREEQKWKEIPACFTRRGAAALFGESTDETTVRKALEKETAQLGEFEQLFYGWQDLQRRDGAAELDLQIVYVRGKDRKRLRMHAKLLLDEDSGKWLIDALEPQSAQP